MHVFNIPASVPFLRTLVTALVDGRLVDGFTAREAPERLAAATIYLPTQRAVRDIRRVFLDVLGKDAALLPRVVALGDIDDDELIFADAATGGEAALEVLPAIGGLERRLRLAQLIAFWAKQKAIKGDGASHAPLVIGGAASSLAMADELGRLMDDMITRGVEWAALKGLVPDDLDIYWQLSLDFLKIAADAWPDFLKAGKVIEPAQRRDLLIAAEARRLATLHTGPVIAAGSTGSMPATARFLHAVAKLPQGAVVLPGLDVDLDETAWSLIGGDDEDPSAPSHPQFAMHGLLELFGIKRRDVVQLAAAGPTRAAPSLPLPAMPGEVGSHRDPGEGQGTDSQQEQNSRTAAPHPDPLPANAGRGGREAPHGRELLLSEAMRPSATTAAWSERLREADVAGKIEAAMVGIGVIEAPSAEMEALAIAIAMREARELDLTAALVTPDRALARRVQMALGRWSLAADDSRGETLMTLPAGLLARLAATCVAERLAPAPLLALLKHPLLRLGRHPGGWRGAIETLELALLRGTRPAAGSAGLATALANFRAELVKLAAGEPSSLHRLEQRARINPTALDEVALLVTALREALAPLEQAGLHAALDFEEAARRHRDVIAALATDAQGQLAAFDGEAGTALANIFETLTAGPEPSGLKTTLADYPELFETAFGDHMVRPRHTPTAGLRIYGPLESRLTEADRVIIGGLVEGTWPAEPRNDPWLSRPMRRALGLDLPERRIGLAAHDFAQLTGAREVILSHAAKLSGAPTVPSRFLHRLQAVAGDERWAGAVERGQAYLHLADALDQSASWTPIARPAPKPPRTSRPTGLSVTEIEDWLRDPYTIYARHVLALAPLDPVDMPLSAANRGTAIHNALGEFTQRYPKDLPDDVADLLREMGAKHFADFIDRPEARALWWPRFLRIAAWFQRWEAERRRDASNIYAEMRGSLKIPIDGGFFTLSARADRIERKTDGTFAILDYKTGKPPSAKQVSLGLSPQMTLEAAILREGGFAAIPPSASISELTYVRLSGNEPPGEATPLELTRDGRKSNGLTPDEAAADTRRKLEVLVRRFESEDQPYISLNLPMWETRYGTYDNLSRIKEWSALGGTGEEDIFN
jgi:ATP-dependent helicase/nuclease subunit B